MGKNKSSGLDGIAIEFYLKVWDTILPILIIFVLYDIHFWDIGYIIGVKTLKSKQCKLDNMITFNRLFNKTKFLAQLVKLCKV